MDNYQLDIKLDEFVAVSRKMNGQVFHEREQWNTSVTADAIRQYAYGISDDNPLWINREHAEKSSFGQLVAPPSFVASVLYPALHGAPMIVPLSSLIGELECTWFAPILEGDELRGAARQLGVFESRNRQGRRLVNILAEVTYQNQRGEVVARAESLMVRVEQCGTELLTDRSIYKYTDDELQVIKKALESETRTGPHELTSDQARVGYQLEPLVRGPLTLGDLVCWQAAIGPSYRAGALGYRDCMDQPHTAVLNPVTGWPVKYSQQHEDALLSQQRGMPAPFDNTVMRWAWLSPLVTDWIGDHGILKRLGISANEPVLYGDTNWYRGMVTKRIVKDTGVTLILKITGTNQLGVVTTTGEAEVEIPHHAIRPVADRVHLQGEPKSRTGETIFHPAHEVFELQAAATPATVALVCDDQQLTYGQLNNRSNQLARHIAAIGIRPGDCIGVCVARSMDMVIGQLAILKSGGVYLPLDPEYLTSRLCQMLDDTSTSILLTHRDMADVLSGTEIRAVFMDADWGQVALQSDQNPQAGIRPDDHAYIMYTSGSAGEPKATAIAHLSLSIYIDAIRKEVPLQTDDNYLYTASPCFSASIRQTMLPLCSGATLVIANSEQRRDAQLLFETMRKYDVSVWDTVPSVWRQYVRVLRAMPDSRRKILLDNRLRLILVTGEVLRWDTPYAWAHEFLHKAAMINLYSQTETSGTVCLYRIPKSPTEQDGVVPLGRPLEGAEVHLLDEDLRTVTSGEVGELCILGERIARGYLNDAAQTAEKFVRISLEHEAQKTFYRTGDLARYGVNQTLLYCGRRDHQVKLHGYRIQLGEIESALGQHAAIQQAVVVMQADTAGDNRLVAYAVTMDCPLPTIEQLRAFLTEKIPGYMVPSVFVELTELPLTPSGKVDRAALPSPRPTRPVLESSYIAPKGPIEEGLVGIWEEVLGVERIGVNDNFFSLGGDSLSATQVASRINEAFRIELPVRQLLESPTARAVATRVFEHLAKKNDESELSDLLSGIKGSGQDH
jgi:amino acid adenylation domain-containing protein